MFRRRQYKYVHRLTCINYISSDYNLEIVAAEKSSATATKFSFDKIVFAPDRFPRIDGNIVKWGAYWRRNGRVLRFISFIVRKLMQMLSSGKWFN